MGLFFYNIFLLLFRIGVRIAAPFNTKAKKWLQGRKGVWDSLESGVTSPGAKRRGSQESRVRNTELEVTGQEALIKAKTIWVHCASLGEFEQGRPVIEKLKAQYPDFKLLLTFFSPSGYEIRKDYKGADMVIYLPMDGPRNAKRFVEHVQPSLVIFVKYEFWYYYLREVHRNKIPLLLISALFRENSVFFKWYGGLQRKMLSFFDHLFVQNERSQKLLAGIGFDRQCSIGGDTRFDRVIEIAQQFTSLPVIENFVAGSMTIVAGSTWSEDEQVLNRTMAAINDPSLKLIIAPHEINKEHIAQIQKLLPESVLYSELAATSNIIATHSAANGEQNQQPPTSLPVERSKTSNILIIDNIGMLSRLYHYGYITYIGGGFGKGIHNTLEAAVYGKPVLFGPAYHKFQEAIDLVAMGGAASINNAEECISVIEQLMRDKESYKKRCESSKDYVYTNRGATGKIIQFIQENRLLTN